MCVDDAAAKQAKNKLVAWWELFKRGPLGTLLVAVDGEEKPVRLARLPALSLLSYWNFP